MSRRLAVLLACSALLLSACAQPAKQYVNASTYGMYFALPRAWQAVPIAQLEKAQTGWDDDPGKVFAETLLWQGAWGAEGVTPLEVFDATPSDKPIAYAFVRQLLDVEQGEITDDVTFALQDIVLPVTGLSEAGVDVDTRQWRKNGFVGIRQSASYPSGGVGSTVDVVLMLSPNRQRLYSLVLRCSESCFAGNRDDFEQIIDSLTFEETSDQSA